MEKVRVFSEKYGSLILFVLGLVGLLVILFFSMVCAVSVSLAMYQTMFSPEFLERLANLCVSVMG